jgi:hypothetical protein
MLNRILAFAFCVLFPAIALAAPTAPAKSYNPTATNTRNALEDVALNAAAGSRTITVPLGGNYKTLKLFVWLDYTAATTLVVTPSESTDGTNFASVASRSIVAGAGTVTSYTDTKAAGADVDMALQYNVEGLKAIKFVVSGASGGAADFVDAQWVAIP